MALSFTYGPHLPWMSGERAVPCLAGMRALVLQAGWGHGSSFSQKESSALKGGPVEFIPGSCSAAAGVSNYFINVEHFLPTASCFGRF